MVKETVFTLKESKIIQSIKGNIKLFFKCNVLKKYQKKIISQCEFCQQDICLCTTQKKVLWFQLKVSLSLTILLLIIMGAANLLKSIELLNLIIFYFVIKDEEKWEGRHSGVQLINTPPLVLWGIVTALEWVFKHLI